MQVREILSAKGGRVVTIRPDATVATAVHRLALERVGALVVSEDGSAIAGILSERDVVAALAEQGAGVLAVDLRVSDLMTRRVITCRPEDQVKTVMAEMTRRRVRHLPVVEGSRLMGIVSIGDVVKSRLEEMELETLVLRDAYIAAH
ncbi:MAG: CBS domain-containing protein [Geminicoccaceae bacterium]